MTADFVPSGAPGQCEYEKPHPSHSWWAGVVGKVGDYCRCEGVKDPNPPPFGENGQLTHSKQALAEYELWLRGKTQSPAGERHLHFLYVRGHWEWVVRWSKSGLCDTPRCRLVTIKEANRARN